MRPISEIIIHATATRPDFMPGASTADRVAEIKRWHVEGNGWSDIGYHFLIDRDGTVAKGRPVEIVGAHVKGHNTGTIGVSLFGGHGSSETDDFAEHFTPQQERALLDLLAELGDRYGIEKITGHNQYAAKACPGFSVPQWLKSGPSPQPVAPAPTKAPSGLLAALLRLLSNIFGKGKA